MVSVDVKHHVYLPVPNPEVEHLEQLACSQLHRPFPLAPPELAQALKLEEGEGRGGGREGEGEGGGGVASASYATNELWADCPQRQVNAGDGSRAAAVPRDGKLAMASKGDFAQLPPWPLLHLAACDASKESEKDALALIRTAAVSVLQGGRDSNSPRKVFEGSDWQ